MVCRLDVSHRHGRGQAIIAVRQPVPWRSGRVEVVSVSHPQARSTRQKRALASVLESAEGFRSAQELHAELRARGEAVGLTTVYSQLRNLADAGGLDVLRSDDGEILYRRCDTESHHHHLVCRSCGRTVEVEGPEVERWSSRVAAAHDYVDVAHTVEILGTCSACADPGQGSTTPREPATGGGGGGPPPSGADLG